MALNWKRIILLTLFIFSVLVLGYLLYYFFLKPAIPPTQPGINANVNGGVLPGAGTNINIPTAGNVNGALPGGVSNVNISRVGPPAEVSPELGTASPVAIGGLTEVKPLTNTSAYDTTLTTDDSIIYYDKTSGLIYKITADGKATPLSKEVFYQVENITWSPNQNKAVLEYPDGANIVYDFVNNKQITLPKHWKEFSFSPTGDQLVFKSMGDTDESRWVAISNSDGSQATKIEHLGDKDATVSTAWSPNGQIIATWREDINFDRQNLFFLGTNNENFKSTIIEGRGFQGSWAPKGDRLLYSVYSSANDYKPSLWIVDAQGDNIGQNRINLKLDTWASKCSFANENSIYCAVPTSLPQGAGIFYQELDNSPCEIYKVDLKTGVKAKIAIPQGNHNISNVIVNKDESNLYFTDKDDGRLYEITLK